MHVGVREAAMAYRSYVMDNPIPDGSELEARMVAWRQERRARREGLPMDRPFYGMSKKERSTAATADLSIGY